MFSHSSYHFWPPNFFLRISPIDKKDGFTQKICLEYFLSSTILCILWPNESTYVVGTAWKESLFYKWEKKASFANSLRCPWCVPRPCCSWFISLHPGETARPQPWIRISSTVTASPPAALTAKRATWWTTATAAWCICPVGNLPTCCIKDTLVKKKNHRANFKDRCERVFLARQAMRPTAPPSCTRNVLTQLSVRMKGFVCNQR